MNQNTNYKYIDGVEHEWVEDPFCGGGEWMPLVQTDFSCAPKKKDEDSDDYDPWYVPPSEPEPQSDQVETPVIDHSEAFRQYTFSMKPHEQMEYEKRVAKRERRAKITTEVEEVESYTSADHSAVAKYHEKEAQRKRLEEWRENNPDYEPIDPLPLRYGHKAIRLVFDGMSPDEAFQQVCDEFGYTPEESKKVRSWNYYNYPAPKPYHTDWKRQTFQRSFLLDPFKAEIRKLTREKYLVKKHINHKNAPSLMSVLVEIHRGLTTKYRIEEQPKVTLLESLKKFDVDVSGMSKGQLVQLASDMKQAGFTYDQIAKKVSKSEKTIRNWLK